MEKLNAIANALSNWISQAQAKKQDKADSDVEDELNADGTMKKPDDSAAAKAQKSINTAMNMQKK